MEAKSNRRNNTLMLAVLSGGEIKKDICRQICGQNEKCYKSLMERMRLAGEVETKFGTDPRTLCVRRAGVERIKDQIPWIWERFKKGQLAYKQENSQRHADISQVLYNMQLCDIPYYPTEKPELYADDQQEKQAVFNKNICGFYCPMEVKNHYRDELKESRLCGYLAARGKGYIVYNTADRGMVFNKKPEDRALEIIRRCVNCKYNPEIILFGDGFEQIDQILKNSQEQNRLQKAYKKERVNKITSDLPMYFIPNGNDCSVYMKALFYKQDIDDIKNELIKQVETEIVSMVPLHLPTCNRLLTAHNDITVLCLEGQKTLAKKLTAHINAKLLFFPEESLETYLNKRISHYKEQGIPEAMPQIPGCDNALLGKD